MHRGSSTDSPNKEVLEIAKKQVTANGRLGERLCSSLPVGSQGLTCDGKGLANLLFCRKLWLEGVLRDPVVRLAVPKQNLVNPGNS